MSNTYAIIDGELYHWGIRGMKWGRRRYQNKDGSLTPEGRKRYADDDKLKSMSDDDVNKAIARSQLEERYNSQVRAKEAREGSYRTKAVKDMSDEELVRAIERSRLEATYKQLNPEPVNAGKEFAKKVIGEAVVPALISSGKNFLEKSLNKLTEKYMGVEVDELAKLKREFDIEDYKKKINDLKNPEENIDDTISKIKKKYELERLTDDELQSLEKEAAKAKLKQTIKKGVDPDDDDSDDGDSGSNNKGNKSDKGKKDKNDKSNKLKDDDIDYDVDDDSDDTMTRAERRAQVKAEKAAIKEARAAAREAEEEAREAEIERLTESIKTHTDNAKRIRDDLDRRLAELDDDDDDVSTIRVSSATKIGENFVSDLLSRASASQERRANRDNDSSASVSRIKSMRNSGKSVAEIAEQLGVSESTVRDLLNS